MHATTLTAAIFVALASAKEVSWKGKGNLIVYPYNSTEALGCVTTHGLWTGLDKKCATITADVTESGGRVSSTAGYCGNGVTKEFGDGFSCGLKQSMGLYDWNIKDRGFGYRLEYHNYYGNFVKGQKEGLDGGDAYFLSGDLSVDEDQVQLGWRPLK